MSFLLSEQNTNDDGLRGCAEAVQLQTHEGGRYYDGPHHVTSLIGCTTACGSIVYATIPEPDRYYRTGERIINYPVGIVVDPPAELAMDADKPEQVDMLRAELRRMDAAA